MTALTMTLLPEPVAPAMSRCGILARSTALAAPATSRPRANVSFDSEAVNSTSSRIRRRATMLKSLLGISMPTALLPGIGASIRSERAARAMARSSESASIRLTLMSGAGWTSYWVTTGPALRATIRAGIPKPASFLTMISSLRRVDRLVAARMDRDRDVLERRQRRHDVLDPVLGQRRIAGIRDVVGVARGAQRGDEGRRRRRAACRREGVRGLALARDGRGDRPIRHRPRRRSAPATGAATTPLPFVAAAAVRAPRPRRRRPLAQLIVRGRGASKRPRWSRPSEPCRPPGGAAGGAGSRSRRGSRRRRVPREARMRRPGRGDR